MTNIVMPRSPVIQGFANSSGANPIKYFTPPGKFTKFPNPHKSVESMKFFSTILVHYTLEYVKDLFSCCCLASKDIFGPFLFAKS